MCKNLCRFRVVFFCVWPAINTTEVITRTAVATKRMQRRKLEDCRGIADLKRIWLTVGRHSVIVENANSWVLLDRISEISPSSRSSILTRNPLLDWPLPLQCISVRQHLGRALPYVAPGIVSFHAFLIPSLQSVQPS